MNELDKAMLAFHIQKIGSIAPRPQPNKSSNGRDFDSILEQKEVQFSKHAEKRLNSRNIELSESDRLQLQEAVKTLETKGARDSLVLMRDMAFIVNVPSKTVVTALAKDQMKEHVFTNIDSTMLVNA